MRILRQALSHVRRNSPWEMVQTAVAVIEDQAFDWRYGVDTRGIRPLEDLAIDSRHVAHGVHYAPTRVRYFRAILRALPIPRDSVFVDLGAGKGRMLLLAAQSGCFRKVVGVEFSAELCRTAEQNIRHFQRHCAGNVRGCTRRRRRLRSAARSERVLHVQSVRSRRHGAGRSAYRAIRGRSATPDLADLHRPQARLPGHPCGRRVQGDRSRHLRECEGLDLWK
jgi:Histone methylation protein DOT1